MANCISSITQGITDTVDSVSDGVDRASERAADVSSCTDHLANSSYHTADHASGVAGTNGFADRPKRAAKMAGTVLDRTDDAANSIANVANPVLDGADNRTSGVGGHMADRIYGAADRVAHSASNGIAKCMSGLLGCAYCAAKEAADRVAEMTDFPGGCPDDVADHFADMTGTLHQRADRSTRCLTGCAYDSADTIRDGIGCMVDCFPGGIDRRAGRVPDAVHDTGH
ncbi:hypothetical protein ACRAWG_25120 [Methylobacterium sp. P31]